MISSVSTFFKGVGSIPRPSTNECGFRPSLERSKTMDKFSFTSLVASHRFDAAFSILIFCNAVLMALEAQSRGIAICTDTGYPACSKPWTGAEDVFTVFGWFFGLAFTFEVIAKVSVLKCKYFKSAWNIFDTSVVVLWVVEKVLTSVSVDPTVIRLARMARLVRLVRMVRTIQAFDSLQVLLGSIQASASALFWSSCLLLLIQMIVGLALHNLLTAYMSDPNMPDATRQQIYSYFGSFSRSMISMFELTLANWPQICWMLVNQVSEWYGLAVVLYKLVVGFAVLVVVTGVFLHETFKVASSDDDLMLVQKQRATKNHARKMERLFREADTSNDGIIDRDEFKKVLKIDKVRTWLSAMELEVSDPDLLFDFLDDGDEVLTVEELIGGVARLKGSARNIDVVALMHNVNKLYDLVEELQQGVASRQQSSQDARETYAERPPVRLSVARASSVGMRRISRTGC
mmetsp:Transcript_14543/g.45723  ORF Transcript_14543/g.45723 Transcript_14543/m.45723 type:complete len:460 (-) Transcript_14543:20-1399(-)